MAKILLINPVVRMEDDPKHVPYGMALLAALAMKEGHLVNVYDDNAWRMGNEVVKQAMQADDWDVIGIGGISTTHACVKRMCKMAKEVKPDSLLVVGGGILTALPWEIMKLLPEIDIGVIGEAFHTFNEILAQVDAQELQLDKIQGIIFRDEKREINMTGQRPLLQDLDSLPYPAFDLFPLEEVYFPNSSKPYSEEGFFAKRRIDINMSYGCSLVCKFCFHLGIAGDMKYVKDEGGKTNVEFDVPGSYERQIRYHSAEYVVGLVKHLRNTYDVDYIGFLDENLMTMDQYSKRTWLKDICEGFIREGLAPRCCTEEGFVHDENCKGIHWGGTSHASLCRPDILKLMKKAGCSDLIYGYESFSPQILKRLGKGSNPETNIRSLKWTLEAGIRPIPNQMMGFPTEDFASLRANMDAWDDLGIVVKPFFSTPYPGSYWFHMYRKRILDQYDGDLEAFLLDLGDATNITAVISENFSAPELYGLREIMVRKDRRKFDAYERDWKKRHPHADAIALTDGKEEDAKTKRREVVKIDTANEIVVGVASD